MRIGDLDQRAVIQQATPTTDSAGGRSESWGTLATVWANVAPGHGRESMDAQQIASYVPYDVTIRYRTDVTAKMRLSWAGKTLGIRAVESGGMRLQEWTILRCEARL